MEQIFFIIFVCFIVGILLLDLLVIGKKSHEVSIREAAVWSAVWISLALLFAVFLRFFAEHIHGMENIDDLQKVINHYSPSLKIDSNDFAASLEIYRKDTTINYLSGYLIEKSLSVDNLFVMMAILSAFSVKRRDYKKVLFWGILGAILMRFIFIFAGAALIYHFEWVLYIFGVYLVYIGIKMIIDRNKDFSIEPQNQPLVRFLSKKFNVFPRYVKSKFLISKEGRLFITPLLIVLIIIELSDLIFAFDSIPAIFSVTRDPYIVFFSNIFAILGLRSLFFLLIRIVDKFYLLKIGVAILLVFVGIKLLAHEWLNRHGFMPEYSLYFILSILVASVVFSIIFPVKANAES